MRILSFAALLAGCGAPRELPWVHGLEGLVTSTGMTGPRAPADDDGARAGCGIGASRTVELVADVAPAAGRETVVVSYRDGISVFDSEDHLLADAPGYPCEGTADEVEVVAFGHADGEPMLVVAATSGGRREAATWVALLRTGRTLDAVFTAVVETRVDGVTTRGAIHLFPGGLLYERPGGRATFWRLEPGTKRYVPILPELPHDEPVMSRR